uniref:Protein kinase domain-containing protein n=1 Tax=Oryza brachyantha TaxID=4533 RepID=J3MVK0_ORYBR
MPSDLNVHARHCIMSMAIPLLLSLLLVGVQVTRPAAAALSQDGVLLLSFKFSLLADPLGSLSGWGYADDTPCAWNGVVCMAFPSSSSSEVARVVSVVLPNAQLVGPIARELGLIEHLRHLDLSGNALNGTLPAELLRAPELRVLSLAGNGITGELPEQVGQLRSLRALNLAGNALSGPIPANLTVLPNLTAVSLANNFFSGALPTGGFPALQVLDVSSNLLNGTLPPDFGGAMLRYVNLSSNHLSGAIPPELASRLPANVSIDLSYNNLTGAIPTLAPFTVQRPTAFAGNADLCGRPLDSLCAFASSAADPPNGTTRSPPAIAAIPKNPTEALPGDDTGAPASGGQGRMRMATIIAIAAGDVAGIAVLVVVFMYVYQMRKKRQQEEVARQRMGVVFKKPEAEESPDGIGRSLSCCLRKKAGDESDSTEEVTDTSSASFAAKEGVVVAKADEAAAGRKKGKDGGAVLVTVDGDVELEMETLLKASAYILGAAGSSIVYKAVLADGAVLAVRRIGSEDAGLRRFSEFDGQMRAIARLRHGNILRLRGFYWGPDEMLPIHDFAANGSLANLSLKRPSGSGEAAAQYQAPEGVKNQKANTKWDVYSFGMVLLELVAGRALTSLELCQWSSAAAAEENGQQVFRLADAALRGEMTGREEALASCLRLGFACCATAPHKRPSMKEVAAAMDRIPSPSAASAQ